MTKSIDKFTFRLTHKESLQSEYINVSDVELNPDSAKKYSDEAIKKAKQLKRKHGSKYTDEYYLKYGKSLVLQEVMASNVEIYKNRLNFCDIKDMAWAGYSYEEILAMEANGYKIPEEVLQWAHAQQQSDVTDYVIVSDVNASEESGVNPSENELKKLQNIARKQITQSENFQKKIEEKTREFNLIESKALNIKKDKEKSYKTQMQKITDMTSEWKRLSDKKETGSLTPSESKRFDELSRMLKGAEKSAITEVQVNDSELDKFLSQLDILNEDIQENLVIAKNTIQSGIDLSKHAKQYNSAQLPTITSGLVFDGNGNKSETLYGIKGENIANIAIEKGNELKVYSDDISASLNTGTNLELVNFAENYTNISRTAVNNTINVIDDKFEGSQKYEIDDLKEKEAKNLQKDELGITTSKMGENKNSTSNSVDKLEEQKTNLVKSNSELSNQIALSKEDSKSLIDDAKKINLSSSLNEKSIQQDRLKKSLAKSKDSTAKSKELTQEVRDQNNKLNLQKDSLSNLANLTNFSGVENMAQGVVTTAIGTSLYKTGMSFLESPFGYSKGLALTLVGNTIQDLGEKEMTLGIATSKVGLMGSYTVENSDDVSKNSKSVVTLANNINKQNNEQIQIAEDLSIPKVNKHSDNSKLKEKDLSEEGSGLNKSNLKEKNKHKVNIPSIKNSVATSNAIHTKILTSKASKDLEIRQKNIQDTERLVLKNTRDNEALVNTMNQEVLVAQNEHAKNSSIAQNITSKIETVRKSSENSENKNERLLNKDKLADLTSKLKQNVDYDKNISKNLNKIISINTQNLPKYDVLNKSLNKKISSFDKIINEQKVLSNTSITVGIEALSIGKITEKQGLATISKAVPVNLKSLSTQADPSPKLLGEETLAKGLSQISSGVMANDEGYKGLSVNEEAKNVNINSKITEKLAKNKLYDFNTKTQEPSQIGYMKKENISINITPEIQEGTTVIDDLSTMSASASTNITFKDILTNDKEDIKLSRFNAESIIESKKKQKKVQAVMAYTRNKK